MSKIWVDEQQPSERAGRTYDTGTAADFQDSSGSITSCLLFAIE
jgi:hypothetical protein